MRKSEAEERSEKALCIWHPRYIELTQLLSERTIGQSVSIIRICYRPSRFSPIFTTSPAPMVISRSPWTQCSSR